MGRLAHGCAGLLALLCGACEGRAAPPTPAPGALPAAASPAALRFALVYERVVGGNQDIYLLPPGGPERRLTDDPAQDGLPRFTPDGQRVVFSSERGGHYQLWEVDVAGGPARRLRTNEATEYQADVSPDGRTLAFLSSQGGPESLWLMDLASGQERLLVRHGRRSILGNPHWSRDGSRITFSSNWRVGHQIYVVQASGGEAGRVSPLLAGGCEPRFRPDGRAIVYVSRGHHGDQSRLVEHDLASGAEKVLVGWPGLNYDPVYSPDGTELAFASNRGGSWAIYRIRLADGASWPVTSGPEARYPDYAPR